MLKFSIEVLRIEFNSLTLKYNKELDPGRKYKLKRKLQDLILSMYILGNHIQNS